MDSNGSGAPDERAYEESSRRPAKGQQKIYLIKPKKIHIRTKIGREAKFHWVAYELFQNIESLNHPPSLQPGMKAIYRNKVQTKMK